MGRPKVLLDPGRKGREAEGFERALRKRVVGQEEAIRGLVEVYQTWAAGMAAPAKPIASFLFLGPTGSGKTRLVEAAAEALLGDVRAVVKIDCGEFQHSHEIAKLVGSPPGYLGHRETHPALSQETLNQFHGEKVKLSVVLFDEIEKASDALWNLLLGILDKATLTLGDNRRVDFSRALIFMTSNLGASEMNALLQPGLGFAAGPAAGAAAGAGKLARTGVEAARRRFTPEFMNRIDRTVVFQPLGAGELRRVLAIELKAVQQRIGGSTGGAHFAFSLSEPARDYLLREGTDARYGARPLKRAIDRCLVHPLANLMATGQVREGERVFVDFNGALGRLVFLKEMPLVSETPCAPSEAAAAA
jgi:ATP-dependent Clp protease ATP-binding subunit ClpB